jgi:hypothetical protein
MDTMTSGFGKSVFGIKPGDRIRSKDVNKIRRAKIISVDGPNQSGKVIVTTDEGVHTFEPGQPVAFPRRANGLTKIHLHPKPHIQEVAIGDVIPTPDGTVDLENGRFITDIQPSQRFNGFVVSYRQINGNPGGKMIVGMQSALFYGHDWLEFDEAEQMIAKSRFKAEPKNTSGVYEHLESGEKVRFKIAGRRGRPPQDFPVTNITSSDIADWDPWLLVSGERHPSDPRK